MKLCLKYAATALLAALAIQVAAQAGTIEYVPDSELDTRYPIWHIAYDIRPDGSYTETQQWSQTILKESAVEDAKQASFSFSTSVAQGEVLEAYTIKKSGARIEVPKNNYQVSINKGNGNDSPLFSDRTNFTVVFPDVSVGDTVVIAYRIDNATPMFPGHFSVAHGFSEYFAYDDVRVTITAPTSLKVNSASTGMLARTPFDKNGARTWVWEYKNGHARKWTPDQDGIFRSTDYPSIRFSTFGTYADIAAAYGARATPKAAVTSRTRELAASIAAGKSSDKERAKTLYDWVARNITYAGNCIGIGAVVPHDIDLILDNKMGDCKDHATLLQALLASVGIESEQALVNAGEIYDLPDIPVASTVNHVINYIPSMNLFVDSTASYVPFGMLPTGLGEKPVLLVSHYRDGMKIPSLSQYGHTQHMKTSLKVNGDGSAEGNVDIRLNGDPAISTRNMMKSLQKNQEDLVVRNLISSAGLHGKGQLSRENADDLLDHYRFDISLKIDDLVAISGAGGIPIKPIVSSQMPITQFLHDAFAPQPQRDVSCSGGISIEEYEIEFPDTMDLLALPKDSTIASEYLDYKSTYKLDGRKLSIKRELKDKTPFNICSPTVIADYAKAAKAVLQDIKAQVLIKTVDASN